MRLQRGVGLVGRLRQQARAVAAADEEGLGAAAVAAVDLFDDGEAEEVVERAVDVELGARRLGRRRRLDHEVGARGGAAAAAEVGEEGGGAARALVCCLLAQVGRDGGGAAEHEVLVAESRAEELEAGERVRVA